ncbi:hypothetical protein Amac_038310 [Acrocarpospora macrocephala]|uniref:Uncharacterized protein n=1 Tax=Acrocarpospora macrocephala TaxID=150177 RepID=A0A5M3WMW7_9ACTN|nr:hypothetical protein Amac_038310 [Acrocarpospora macrocephala]
MPHGQHHLDHTGDARGGLRVTDVRLDRTQQQRTILVPIPAIGRQQRLRFDRVTQRRTGAVPFNRVHISGREPRPGQGLADHPPLRRTVRSGQTVGRAVLVDRGTPDDRQDLVTVAARVRQTLQHQHADALGPARAVGRVGVGLAPAVRGQAALPREVDERPRSGHHRHTTGQRERAVTAAQRLRREVHRHQ